MLCVHPFHYSFWFASSWTDSIKNWIGAEALYRGANIAVKKNHSGGFFSLHFYMCSGNQLWLPGLNGKCLYSLITISSCWLLYCILTIFFLGSCVLLFLFEPLFICPSQNVYVLHKYQYLLCILYVYTFLLLYLTCCGCTCNPALSPLFKHTSLPLLTTKTPPCFHFLKI